MLSLTHQLAAFDATEGVVVAYVVRVYESVFSTDLEVTVHEGWDGSTTFVFWDPFDDVLQLGDARRSFSSAGLSSVLCRVLGAVSRRHPRARVSLFERRSTGRWREVTPREFTRWTLASGRVNVDLVQRHAPR